ncbi:HTH domain-containing protein [Streptomyces sp. NPDC004685]
MSALSVEVRRIVVAHLTDRHMSAAQIATELGVSRETVRRDLLNRPPAAEPDTASDEAPDEAAPEPQTASNEPFTVRTGPEGLTLAPSLKLGQDLRIIAASHKRPAEDVAEDLLHWHAERIRARWAAQRAAS